jgi:hypothetical protein
MADPNPLINLLRSFVIRVSAIAQQAEESLDQAQHVLDRVKRLQRDCDELLQSALKEAETRDYTREAEALQKALQEAGQVEGLSEPGGSDAEGAAGKPSLKLDACKAWLARRLAGGAARVSVVRTEANAACHSEATLYKARDALGVVEFQPDRYLWWKMPDGQEHRPETPF